MPYRYKSRAYYEGLLREPNVQRALSVIRQAEHSRKTVDPYRTAVTNKPINDLSKHPNKAYVFNSKGKKSTAAGAYQFLNSTWNEIAGAVGLTDFTPRSQDIAAVARIDWRGGLDNVLAGDFKGFVRAVANEWVSFPENNVPDQNERSWAFMERAWREAGPTAEAATEAGLYDTIFGRQSPTPNENTFQIAPGMMNAIFGNPGRALIGGLGQQASAAGLYDTIMGSAGAAMPYMPAVVPKPSPSPRSGIDPFQFGLNLHPAGSPQGSARDALGQIGHNGIGHNGNSDFNGKTRGGSDASPEVNSPVRPGTTAIEPRSAPIEPVASPANGLLGSPEAFASQRQSSLTAVAGTAADATPKPNAPPAEYQNPAFSTELPKVDAYQHPPVPGLQPSSAVAIDTEEIRPGEIGYDAFLPDQLGSPPRSTDTKMVRGRAPLAAAAHGNPSADLATRGLATAVKKSARPDPGYFPDAPFSPGGLFGNLFGPVPAKGNASSIADIVKSGPGSASYAGSGMSGIQGVISSTGPGVANPGIGTVAASRSNPGFSVVGLGPMGYGRQSSKYGWTETVTPFGTSFAPHSTFSVTEDPETGRRSVSRVDTRTGKMTPIAATRGPSRGLSFGRGPAKGLASFFSSLFNPAVTTAPAVGPAVVAFAPGPTTGPLGFSPGGRGGFGSGFAELGGSLGPAGPAFGGGAHSNSTDSRGL